MNKKILSSVLIVTILVGCGEGEDRQAKYLERAEKYFAEENYSKAKVDARNVLQINPKNSAARLVLGNISYEEGNIRQAYGMYQAVIEEEPENIGAHTGLTKLYTAVKGFDQAIEHADKVLEKEPDNADVLGFKSVALAGLERSEEAETLAKQALALDAGNAPALGVMTQALVNREQQQQALDLLEKGQAINSDEDRIAMMKIAVLENMGNADAVETELKKLAAKHPESRSFSDTLARYYIRDSRFDEAEKEVRTFAENNGDSLEAKRRLISYLQQHKSQEAAIAQAQSYIDADPDRSDFYISLARLHLFTGDQEQGVKILEQAVDTDPRSVGAIEARNMLAQISLQNENYDQAKKILAEILDIEPENEAALLRRAGLSLADGKLKDGIADLRVVLKNNPENVVALDGLARAQEANGNEQLALDNYKKLMTLKQPTVETLISAARLAIKGEQYPEAEKYIRLALEQEGENAGLITNLIRLLVLKEDWEAASSFAQRLVDSEDSKALGYYLQAGLNLRLEEKDQALKNLRASLAEKPEAVESLTSLAQVMNEVEGRDKTIAFIQAHCDKYPEQAHCRYILGSLYAQATDFGAAENELKAAIEINDQLIAGYRQLAKVYAAQKNLAGIEQIIKQGIDATDANPLKFELATFYYGTQRYQESADTYQAILDKNENAIAAKNNLAMIYAENLGTPEDLKAARALVADLQESENAAYLDTVGWVMYLSGDYEQAISYLTAAVDKVGSSGLLQYHLGMAYYKAGDKEAAKTHLTLAVENKEARYTGFDVAEQTLKSL